MISEATTIQAARRRRTTAAVVACALLVLVLVVLVLGRPNWGPSAGTGRDELVLETAIGATFAPLDPVTGRSLGDGTNPNDLVVTSVATDGIAGRAGIRTGDIVEQINGRRASDFSAAAASVKQSGSPLTLVILRRGKHIMVQLPIRPAPDTD